jgi:hypothetical protein
MRRQAQPSFLTGLGIGLFILAIQVWVLLVSFDLYVHGKGGRIWQLGLAAGLVFFGGLVMLWVHNRSRITPARR